MRGRASTHEFWLLEPCARLTTRTLMRAHSDVPRRKSGSAGADFVSGGARLRTSRPLCPQSMSTSPPASGARAGRADRKSSSESDDIPNTARPEA